MNDGYISADEALKEKEEVEILTSGISMRPMLRQHRDIVVIERVTRKLKRNDVPLYKRPGQKALVLHRILKVTKDGYVIRGDNLLFKEYNVKDEDIVGVLKAFYRDGKYINCSTNVGYKIYVFLNRASFPLKFLWRTRIRPVLSKIKHTLIK